MTISHNIRFFLLFLILTGSATMNLKAQDIQITQDPVTGTYAFRLSDELLPEGASVLWDLGDGQVSELATPRHVFHAAGQYEIRVFVWMPDGRATRYTRDLQASSLQMYAGNEPEKLH